MYVFDFYLPYLILTPLSAELTSRTADSDALQQRFDERAAAHATAQTDAQDREAELTGMSLRELPSKLDTNAHS